MAHVHFARAEVNAGLGKFDKDRQHTRKLMKIAIEFDSRFHWCAVASARYSCILSAVLLAETEQLTRAVELLALAPSSGRYGDSSSILWENSLAALQANLPPDEFESTYQYDQTLDLPLTLRSLLLAESSPHPINPAYYPITPSPKPSPHANVTYWNCWPTD